MPSINLLAHKLQSDFPAFTFTTDSEFRWSPTDMTIYYDSASEDCASFLHEVSHAILDHKHYNRDIELLELERAAWNYTQQTLSLAYFITIDENVIEDSLDTYRDWLHARSLCPHCKSTGLETKKREYRCLVCQTKWRVNDARICALRRYRII